MASGARHPGPVRDKLRITYYSVLLLMIAVISDCRAQRDRDNIRRMEVVSGGNITLTCSAQPGHLRAYRWVYIRTGTKRPQVLSSGRRLVVGEPRIALDSKAEDEKVKLKLTLTDIRPYESGIFMCWRQGLKPDPQILLTVLEPGMSSERQVITRTDGPSHVKYGDSATFTCTISPPWPVKVTWLKDGVEIPDTDRLYTQSVRAVANRKVQEERQDAVEELLATLTVVTIRKDTNFTCHIETDPPDERTIQVTVRVPRVVSLMSEPDKDTVEYGQSLSLSCIVSGSDSEIVWLKDGSELLFGHNFLGRQKYTSEQTPNMMASTVHIESVSFIDNGHYVCYIPGASKDILINIEGRPARLLGMTSGDFFEDEALTLSCTTQYAKDTQRSTVRWHFEDEVLDPSFYETRMYRLDYNMTVHELTIPRAGEQNAGKYQCVTPYGSASKTVNLFVPPSLSEPLPSELLVKEGEELRITCQTIGRPRPVVHWERKIGELWLPVDEVLGRDVDTDGVLTVPVAAVSDAGNYRCAAKSDAGSFLAEVVVSVERASPEVFDMAAPESVTVGDNFTIQCSVMNWNGEVEFMFEGASLSSHLDSRYNVILYPSDDGIVQAYLIVQGALPEDAGTYTCSAGSQASESVLVEVSRRPGEIVNLVVSPTLEGEDFFVSCTIRNWLKEVRFYHKGNILSEDTDPRYSVYKPEPSQGDATHVLKVTSAGPEDEGTYQCYLDAFTTHTIDVSLKSPAEKVLGVSASAAVVGRDFNITCRVKNWDDTVTFIFNGVALDPDKDWRYVVYVYPSDDGNQEITHVLSVSEATTDDNGLYECYTTTVTSGSTIVTVWNEADVKLELKTVDQPNWKDSPIPINCEVRGVDPNTVTILFSHYDEPQVYIQNRTKMATSSHLVNIAVSQSEEGSVPITVFTLGFYSLSKELEGLWSCTVLHPSGDILGSDTLSLEIAGFSQAESLQKVQQDIVTLANNVSFEEVMENDVVELLDSHREDLTNEDLMMLEQERAAGQEEDIESPPTPLQLTRKDMSKAFALIEEGLQILADNDPNRERNIKIASAVNNALSSYTELYKEKPPKEEREYPCPVCGKVFTHPSSLIYHRDSTHNNGRMFVCHICNAAFKHKQLLQRHYSVHSEDRPYPCEVCHTAFKTRGNLYNHMNTHTGLKKFTCEICGKQFNHLTSLTLHVRSHTGEKPFKCGYCEKRFTQNGNLQEHIRIHTGEKPYCCETCGKKFTTSSQFKLHMRRHTGERPFTCSYCTKPFLNREAWRTHERKHSGEKPYVCEVCTKGFTEQYTLRKHLRMHTGNLI
ncbi:obscurin-like [Homarus americanus]|uniref:obscurin-like n=1 Tax=Homarus americanus TaxID=6706 RepID=UPI001C44A4D2|nr:obscurin-like [Homarus americanus]